MKDADLFVAFKMWLVMAAVGAQPSRVKRLSNIEAEIRELEDEIKELERQRRVSA